jgi:hypothetical protein
MNVLSQYADDSETVSKTVFVNLEECYAADEKTIPIPQPPSSSGKTTSSMHPVTQFTIEDLWHPHFESNPYTGKNFTFIVRAKWRGLKHSNVIENSRFSTFQHSKLPPFSWSAELLVPRDVNDFPLSKGLRRLLVILILGDIVTLVRHPS